MFHIFKKEDIDKKQSKIAPVFYLDKFSLKTCSINCSSSFHCGVAEKSHSNVETFSRHFLWGKFMKKFSKSVIALLTSLVFCIVGGGYLTSCSSDDGGDNKVTFTSQTETVPNNAETLGVVTTVVTSADVTIATADYNDDKSEIVITSKKAGSTTLTAKEDADKEDYATISVTVASDGKITANVTKKVGEKAKEEVYFSAFDVTSTGVSANTSDNSGSYTATDGTWSVTGAKIQFTDSNNNSVGVNTYDYEAEAGKGYAYTGRVNIKSGKFTISTKADAILRIDGGSGSNGTAREFAISGADKTSWKPSIGSGSFFFKATSETVTITISSDACNIYGVHVVDTELDPVELSSVTTYTKPTLELSETSVTKGTDVTATVTVPQSVTKTTMSDGTVTETKADVTAEITYKVATVTGETVGDYSDATVTDDKVDTSSVGTFAYTASYTIGTGDDAVTYTSDAVTLEVVGAFAATTEEITNNESTLGLTATSVKSGATEVATVALSEDKSNIVITSDAAGTATITASDGTNSSLLVVSVTASGAISTTVFPYFTTIKWNVDELFGDEEGKTALGDITEDKEIGGLTLYATSAAKFTSQARSKKIGGISFSNALNFNGTSTLTADAKARVIKITTDKAAKITVYGEGSNSGRKFVLSDADLKEVGAKEFTTTQKEDLGIVSAGTYYISATASLRLSQIVIAPVVASDLSAE